MAHHPEISLNVKEFSTEQTIKKLTDSAVDIGIVYRTALPAQLSSTMLFEDEIIAAIPLSHPLATRERLHLKDLNDQPIIVLNDSLLLRGIITTEFNNRKVVPNVICELDNHYSCLEYAEAQIGIAFITRSLTHLSTPKMFAWFHWASPHSLFLSCWCTVMTFHWITQPSACSSRSKIFTR